MRKSLSIFLASLLLVLSVVAAAAGMADIYRGEAAVLIGEIDGSEDEAGTALWAWEQAQRYLWLASRLAPFDAQVLGDLGELYEYRMAEVPAPGTGADLDRALDYYRQALTLRPAWPYAWVDIAALKITRQHIDAEYAHAMQRALTLGPWQANVQASIAGGGLTVWNKLPAMLQTELEDTIARGLSNDSRLMLAVARRFDLIASDGS
jgi:tetratricopeptide (TPR) repeat protein